MVLRSVGAVGTFVLGLHEKREKVPHPGLQHVQTASATMLDSGKSKKRKGFFVLVRMGSFCALSLFRFYLCRTGRASSAFPSAGQSSILDAF